MPVRRPEPPAGSPTCGWERVLPVCEGLRAHGSPLRCVRAELLTERCLRGQLRVRVALSFSFKTAPLTHVSNSFAGFIDYNRTHIKRFR